MGAKHATASKPIENSAVTPAASVQPAQSSATEPAALPAANPVDEAAVAAVPQWFGFPSESTRCNCQLLTDTSAAVIWSAVPPLSSNLSNGEDRLHPDGWALLYHSGIHGVSFSRMVQLIADRGPTVVVIRCASDGGAIRTFGGYNETSWSTVAQREKASRSSAAANARAKRDGMHTNAMPTRPSQQAHTFFGNDHCFVFSITDQETKIYRSRPHINANFMYLFDVHPDDDRIGIGMGGVPPGQFGWFVDRWLESGVCRGTRCSTFHNPMLSATEEWHVDAVEVYAAGWTVVEEYRTSGGTTEDGRTKVDTGASIRKGPDRIVDKIIMELGQVHHFYSDDGRVGSCGDAAEPEES